jgi:uncharacterized delta-60 repeat protein
MGGVEVRALITWRFAFGLVVVASLTQALGALPASAAAGDLDATFGSGGVVTTNFGTDAAGANDVAIRASDGSMVAAGYDITSHGEVFALAKYLSNGSPDPSFGGGTGMVTTAFGHANAQATAVVVQQTTGKIVVAGFQSPSYNRFALARYNPDGTLDTTFSHDGKLTLDFGNNAEANAVAVLPNKDIVVAGFAANASTGLDYALVRYTDAGKLDPSFGTGGIVTTDFFGSDDEISGIAVQPNGKLVVAGLTSNGTTQFSVALYNFNGTLDQSFGVSGVQFTAFETNPDDHAAAVRLGSGGRIIVAGTASKNVSGATTKMAVARYTSSGALDTSFSTDGKVTTSIGSGVIAYGMGIEPAGGIVIAGTVGTQPPDFDMAVVRYTPAGALDSGFGTGGVVRTDLGDDERAYGMRIQSNGRIVVAGVGWPSGSLTSHFLLARYLSA